MKDSRIGLAIVVLLWITAIGLISLVTYSDYQICKEYCPEINPFVCLMSNKVKVIPR